MNPETPNAPTNPAMPSPSCSDGIRRVAEQTATNHEKQQEILRVQDVFQFPDRTVATGIRGEAWDSAKVGADVKLKSLGGQTTKATIRELEVFRRGVLTPPFPGAISFGEILTTDKLSPGTVIAKIENDHD